MSGTELFVKKLYEISKFENFKISDIEKRLNVASGYFSRYLKNRKKHLYLDTALKTCEIIGYKLDEVLYFQTAEDMVAERLKKMAFESLFEDFTKESALNAVKEICKNE